MSRDVAAPAGKSGLREDAEDSVGIYLTVVVGELPVPGRPASAGAEPEQVGPVLIRGGRGVLRVIGEDGKRQRMQSKRRLAKTWRMSKSLS